MQRILFAIIFMLTALLITSCAFKPAIIDAANSGDISKIKKLLAEGRNINEKDSNGATPLMHAIWSKKPDVAKYLIESGADVKANDNYGNALIYAIDYKQHELINLLLDKGADIESRNYLGETAIVHAVLRIADFDAVKILIKRGANVNAKSTEGETVLDLALASARGDIVDKLGVNLWTPDAGKARVFFVGTGLFDYLKVIVGKQTKRLNQNMFVGLTFVDVDSGKHSIDVKEFHAAAGSEKNAYSIDAIAGQTYYFKVTQDMKRRTAHYAGIKLSSVEMTPMKEAEAKDEIKELLQLKKIK
jgi:hypothetical protein